MRREVHSKILKLNAFHNNQMPRLATLLDLHNVVTFIGVLGKCPTCPEPQ